MSIVTRRRTSISPSGIDSTPSTRRKRTAPTIRQKLTPQDVAHDGYDVYRKQINDRVQTLLEQSNGKVFRTDVDTANLFKIYLNGLPARARRYCNCNTCRKFFDEYAGLVVVDDMGRTHPLLWPKTSDETPHVYAAANRDVRAKVKKGNIIGVKLWDSFYCGKPVTGPWSHYAFSVPLQYLTVSKLKSTHELEAEKNEEFGIVKRALEQWGLRTLNLAVELLETDSLYRSEKVKAPVTWLRDLRDMTQVAGRRREYEKLTNNLIWRAVANAPSAFCHPRSAVTASLLDDIQSGYSFDHYSKSFAAKMNPLKYQRPQAAPKVGNVVAATRIFEKLGLARSLERRFADVSEVPLFWTPVGHRHRVARHEIGTGPFAHLLTRDHPTAPRSVSGSVPKTMTWVKFEATFLASAKKIELFTEAGPYGAITAPVHHDAPPLFQWDSEENRNPFAWYTYVYGSTPSTWGLPTRGWAEVIGLSRKPCHWTSNPSHYAEGVFLLLDKAHDTRDIGAAIFPEILKSELHEVRSTIEQYSNQSQLDPAPSSPACGWIITNTERNFSKTKLRVTQSNDLVYEILIDRWD